MTKIKRTGFAHQVRTHRYSTPTPTITRTTGFINTPVTTPSTSHTIPFGTYTVTLSSDPDDRVTIQVSEATFIKDRNPTPVMVSFLFGPDNEISYKGFGFISNGNIRPWTRFQGGQYNRQIAAAQFLLAANGGPAVDEAHEAFLDLAEAYSLESGNCIRCGKTLTVPASLHRGLGPVCASKEGL